MTSFKKMLHPTLQWSPKILPATAHEPMRQSITIPDAKRYASIVWSALAVHFATPESEPSWPLCGERHIFNFLRVCQLPADFITISLCILLQFSNDNPFLYAEADTAELLFVGAMLLIAREYTQDEAMKEKYKLVSYEYSDRRWGADAWRISMEDIQEKLFVSWDRLDPDERVALREFIDETRVMDYSLDADVILGMKETNRDEFNRTVHFMRVFLKRFRPVKEGDYERYHSSAGPLLAAPSSYPCGFICVFTGGALFVNNDEPTGLPIHMGYRPWGTRYDPEKDKVIDTAADGDFRHVQHNNLERWINVHDPTSWKWRRMKHKNMTKTVDQITEGIHQRSASRYTRDKREPMVLNHEEMEIFEREMRSEWGRRVGFGRKYLRVREFWKWQGLMLRIGEVSRAAKNTVVALVRA